MDILDLLERATKITDRIGGRITADQLNLPTPCAEWNVRLVMHHLIADCRTFSTAASGQPATDMSGWNPGSLQIDNPQNVLKEEAQAALAAWKRPGALDQMVTLPLAQAPAMAAANVNLMELYAHTWDLAKATGQTMPDPELAAIVLEAAHQIVGPEFRQSGQVAAEIATSASASSIDRLASFLGRRP